jgi:hypothetical protein
LDEWIRGLNEKSSLATDFDLQFPKFGIPESVEFVQVAKLDLIIWDSELNEESVSFDFDLAICKFGEFRLNASSLSSKADTV